MIVYLEQKSQFLADMDNDIIADKVEHLVLLNLKRHTGGSERRSWEQSFQYVYRVLCSPLIPDDAGVAIEFALPRTNKRIDVIISGYDSEGRHSALIIELKQWSEVSVPDASEHLIAPQVRTYFQGSQALTVHPSYQSYSYRSLLTDFNSSVQDVPITLNSCAYLHNYASRGADDPLFSETFSSYIRESPLFCKGDIPRLRQFIRQFIHTGDENQTLYYLDNGEIRPSKSLQDALSSMIRGNREFLLIDDQEIIFQKMLASIHRGSNRGRKQVYIVEGGPGTGKTVVAIHLLVALINQGKNCAYVTKNSAPRNVFQQRLKDGAMKRREIGYLFRNSGAFIAAEDDIFDTLIVDEAHRLTRQTQLGPRLTGEDQIEEIIQSSRSVVFFIDEDQRVTARDYGSLRTIESVAASFGAEVHHDVLQSQFRCNGSDGYLSFLDDLLGIRETAQKDLTGIDYDIRLFHDVNELRRSITEKNEIDGKARLVAGYCWQWTSKKDPGVFDITIDSFSMQWNLSSDSTYAISAGSIDQVGCIHTVQGLEFSYVGVIIGDDLIFRDGQLLTDYTKRAKSDKSLDGLKGPAKKGDIPALKEIDRIIRNTYRTLMSRGMRGCYIYCKDEQLRAYLDDRLS
ncbi:MAG: DUF2075 domain-containing protein [Sphaerochaetaceae bacterium]|nr:DUF2075 domain-containing protein [Sphaerochaetaceae bacterium]